MRLRGLLAVPNHRGMPTPRTLGIVLAVGGAGSAIVVSRVEPVSTSGIVAASSLLVVFAVGLLDDLVPGGPRGLRAHLRALGEGHVSTGVLKAVVIVACAVVTVTQLPLGVVGVGAGIPLLAGAANLGNALDVRPGRALKFFAPFLIVGVAIVPLDVHPALPGLALCSLPALRRDLAERDMLGDGGSNLLGFAAGLVLLLALPDALLVVAASAAVVLNLLADSIGLSDLIARSRVLTALDRIGRLP